MKANTDTPSMQDARWQEFVKKVCANSLPFAEHLKFYKDNYAKRKQENGPPLIWQPDEKQISRSNIGVFMRSLGFDDYRAFHSWSTHNRADFWEKVIEVLGIQFEKRYDAIIGKPGNVKSPDWLRGAKFNCVDSCFCASLDKPAIMVRSQGKEGIKEVTYGELQKLVNRVANGLRENHFQKGDAIALYMPMTLECVAAYLGIIKAGCKVVSIADSFSPPQLQTRLKIAGAKGIITVYSFKRAGRQIELYEKVKEAKAPRAVVIETVKNNELRSEDLDWQEFISEKKSFQSEADAPDQVINILFSSGTTGEPKAIPWTHLTPIKCAMDGHFHQDIQSYDVVSWPTNIGWMMGPWLIFATFINNATMALYEGAPSSDGFLQFINDSRTSILGTIPSLVRIWRTSQMIESGAWEHVRLFSSTGEPSEPEDYLWLMSLANYRAPVIEYCGGTEIGGGYITGTVVQQASPATFTTPALGLDLVILSEKNKPVKEGEMGESFIIPPSIGLSEKLLNRDHEEIYYTGCPTGPNSGVLRRHGDQLLRLHKGFYKAQGRADDTMNLGGIKVSSLELEQVLNSHPAIYENAAIAVNLQGESGDRLIVFAVLQQNFENEILKTELNSLLAKKLNPLFKVYDLILCENLPRTASNKLMRRTLRDDYQRDSVVQK